MIKGHGNDSYRFKQKIVADFSTNVFFKGIPKTLETHLSKCIPTILNYPEPDSLALQDKIAAHHHLESNQVMVTNGSTEAFYMLANYFRGKISTILTPSFAEYEDAGRLYGHSLNFLSQQSFYYESKLNTDIIWIGNPNNPDGKINSKKTIKQFCYNNPDVVLIVDEAYSELCSNFESSVSLVQETPNLIVVCSLTKTFAIPGIRLGYIVLPEALQEELSAFKIPWSVNSLAQEAGYFIINNYEDLLPDRGALLKCSHEFQQKLNGIDGLEVTASDCNYFLIKLKKGKATDLKAFLIREYGLLIRDASNFRGLDDSFFRLSVQEEDHMQLLIKGIETWLLRN
jgi:threonine-phosphate decarboxylase